MKPTICLLLAAGFVSSCAETGSRPGSALSIQHQDTAATTPGNAPIADRMGVEGSSHYHRKVSTEGMTPLGGGTPAR